MKFTIEVEMKERWVPHFLGMLRRMEFLGNIGSSKIVSLYADGDGDFQPKFKWDDSLPIDTDEKTDINGNKFFDAG